MGFVREPPPSMMPSNNNHGRPRFRFEANRHRRLVFQIERNDSEMSDLGRLPCSHH